MERTEATIRARILDILSGSPPAIIYEKVTRYKGASRLFTQKVDVPDAELFEHICNEVHRGDELSITIVTEWYQDHSIIFVAAIEASLNHATQAIASI